uniref:Peroxin-7 n=1 Tax=Daphnia galeata TaxID=27404 RepID=A0A8J2W4B4_9CRUS|nr:unnamed protein product [Daphnia galeata]
MMMKRVARDMKWSDAAQYLVSSSWDNTIQIWSVGHLNVDPIPTGHRLGFPFLSHPSVNIVLRIGSGQVDYPGWPWVHLRIQVFESFEETFKCKRAA